MSWRAGCVPPVMRWADFTTLLRAMRLWAVRLPYQAVARQDAPEGASVEVCKGLRGQAKFLVKDNSLEGGLLVAH
jgi:hypothetical protein